MYKWVRSHYFQLEPNDDDGGVTPYIYTYIYNQLFHTSCNRRDRFEFYRYLFGFIKVKVVLNIPVFCLFFLVLLILLRCCWLVVIMDGGQWTRWLVVELPPLATWHHRVSLHCLLQISVVIVIINGRRVFSTISTENKRTTRWAFGNTQQHGRLVWWRSTRWDARMISAVVLVMQGARSICRSRSLKLSLNESDWMTGSVYLSTWMVVVRCWWSVLTLFSRWGEKNDTIYTLR